MKENKITKDQVLQADKRIYTILEELEKMGKASDLINTANNNSKESVLTSSELVKINDKFVKDSIKEIKSLREEMEKEIKILTSDSSVASSTLIKVNDSFVKDSKKEIISLKEMLEKEIKALVIDSNKTKDAILKNNKSLYTKDDGLKDEVLIKELSDNNLKEVKKLFSSNNAKIDKVFINLGKKIDHVEKQMSADNKIKFDEFESNLNVNKILNIIILLLLSSIGYLLFTI
jgi:hypothetical protein